LTPLLFLVAWGWLLRALAPGVAGDDSAELTLAALKLDVAHPPGYPLLALAGRLAMALPLGGPAFRMNLLCGAGCGAGAAVLVFLIARDLLRLSGSRGTLMPLVAAGMTLALPAVFHQATACEKYAPHLLLALALLRTFLARPGTPYRPAFALGVALAHHPQAVLLVPLLWPWRRTLRRPPELLLAAALVVLPVSVKVVYPALRAQAAVRDPGLYDWGAPRTLAPLSDYLTVRQYGARFHGDAPAFASRLAPQLAAYGEAMGTGPLVLAWLGAIGLLSTVPAVAGPLLALLPAAWLFAGAFQLPLHLASANHLVPLTVLWILAAFGASRLPCLFAPAVLILTASAGWNLAAARLPAETQDRRFAVWDYNRALVRLAPGNAVLLAGMDNDLFPLRYLAGALEERTDLLIVDPPFETKTAEYAAMLHRVAPGLILPAAPRDDPAALWRALLRVRGDSCIVLSGFLEAVLPGELRFVGPLAVPAARPCADLPALARQPRIWDRLAWRSVRDPLAGSARLRPVTGIYEAALSASIAAALTDGRTGEAASLFAVKQRKFPGLASTFLEAGTFALLRRDAGAAAAAFDRAIAAAPDLLDGYAQLAMLLDAVHDTPGLVTLIRRLETSRQDCDPGLLRAAQGGDGPAVRAVLARAALDEAARLRAEGAVQNRRIHVLVTLAARLEPSRGAPGPAALGPASPERRAERGAGDVRRGAARPRR